MNKNDLQILENSDELDSNDDFIPFSKNVNAYEEDDDEDWDSDDFEDEEEEEENEEDWDFDDFEDEEDYEDEEEKDYSQLMWETGINNGG